MILSVCVCVCRLSVFLIKLNLRVLDVWPSYSRPTVTQSLPKWSLTHMTFCPSMRHVANSAVNHQPRHRSLTWVKVTFWIFLSKTNSRMPHAASVFFFYICIYIPRTPFFPLQCVQMSPYHRYKGALPGLTAFRNGVQEGLA